MIVMRYVASIVGVPSITSVVLLLDLALGRAGRPLLFVSERRILLFALAIIALVLYPSAL